MSDVSPTEIAIGDESPPELETVRGWRGEQLRQAGYRGAPLLLLTDSLDVDLHVAVKLIERGCPQDTALRILL
jgi:hypothetical protein